jgi:SAM-dependent methyltransferase
MVKRAAQPDKLFAALEALSDPARLRILRLLERHELGVSELCDVIQLPQSTVSRHLKLLLEQEWVRSRRQGTTHLYRMILDELSAAARKLWLVAREQTDAAIADLGCGSGAVSEMIAPFVKSVIAVDNSPAMLKAARGRLEKLPNVDIRRGDLSTLPIGDGECSAAVVMLVLSYLPDVIGALKESVRILKPGGRLIVVDLLPHDRDDFRRQLGQVSLGFDPEDFRSTLKVAGFNEAWIQPLPPESQVKGPALFLAVARK